MNSDDLYAWVERLAAIDRSSCSGGEHLAAELIADALRQLGAEARIERPRIHGTYWWPLGITSAFGLLSARAGARGRRLSGAVLGALGTALVFDELGAGRRWLRRLLPKLRTANVIATIGDPQAERTLLIVAHHDAAHTGIFYHPAVARLLGLRLAAQQPGNRRGGLSPMLPIAAGPALAAIGALARIPVLGRLARLVCGGIIASFAHIALSPTVPGANDNVSGVITLLGVAAALRERPVRGLRVMLVSTGAEETLMEGMRAFAQAHFGELDPQRTHVLCVDAVGSPHLVLAEAEGMLRVRPYDERFKELIAGCAQELGVELRRGETMRLGTDGYLALRHGLPAALLMSLNEHGAASNYHWPTDTADRVDYGTLGDTIALCEAVVRRLAG